MNLGKYKHLVHKSVGVKTTSSGFSEFCRATISTLCSCSDYYCEFNDLYIYIYMLICFLSCSTWDLVPWSGIRLWPLLWEPRVLDTGLSEKSLIVVLIYTSLLTWYWASFYMLIWYLYIFSGDFWMFKSFAHFELDCLSYYWVFLKVFFV